MRAEAGAFLCTGEGFSGLSPAQRTQPLESFMTPAISPDHREKALSDPSAKMKEDQYASAKDLTKEAEAELNHIPGLGRAQN